MTKISALPVAAALTGTEIIPIDQSGETRRSTASAIANLASFAINTLPAASALTGSEPFPVFQGGTSKQSAISALLSSLLFTQVGTGASARSITSKFQEVISVKDFGAVGDGVTDDTSAFQNALNSLGTTGGTVVIKQSEKYLIDNNLTVPVNCFILGGLRIVGGPANSETSHIWNYGSRLIINTTKTITLNGGAGIEGCFITRKGMVGPENDSSAFSGVAITAAGDDVLLRSCLLIGFGKLFTSTNFGRATLEDIRGDGINGFEIINALDVPRFLHCHLWPFGTIDAVAPVTTFGVTNYLHRNGIGYLIQTVGDQCRLTSCFDYGHHQSFVTTDANNVTYVDCSADDISQGGSPYTVPGSIGFLVTGTSNETVFDCCQAFAKANCFYQDVAAPTIQRTTYLCCTARYFSDNGFAHVSGMATYLGCRVSGVSNVVGSGINVVASNGTSIDACNLYNVGVAIATNFTNVVFGQSNHFLNVGTTGYGGTVTQATSKSTSVTLNAPTGLITMNGAALAAGTIVSFVFNSTLIVSTDLIVTAHASGGTTGSYTINARATGAGTAAIDVRNNTAGSLSEAIAIRFAVVKSVNS